MILWFIVVKVNDIILLSKNNAKLGRFGEEVIWRGGDGIIWVNIKCRDRSRPVLPEVKIWEEKIN
jgi:hypothetical protein